MIWCVTACLQVNPTSNIRPRNTKGGKYHCTIDLLFDWFGISRMKTDNFCFYLQIRLIQTSQTGGKQYNIYYSLVGQMSVGQMSVGWMSVGWMSVALMSVDQMSIIQMSIGQMSVGQMSIGQKSIGQMSVGQMTVGQMSVGHAGQTNVHLVEWLYL